MPARRDLDPEDIVSLLPHLVISERVKDGVRYKLVGAGVCHDLGYDPTGHFAGEYFDAEFYPEIQAVFDKVYDHGSERPAGSGFFLLGLASYCPLLIMARLSIGQYPPLFNAYILTKVFALTGLNIRLPRFFR
jgi:hypothetical protein